MDFLLEIKREIVTMAYELLDFIKSYEILALLFQFGLVVATIYHFYGRWEKESESKESEIKESESKDTESKEPESLKEESIEEDPELSKPELDPPNSSCEELQITVIERKEAIPDTNAVVTGKCFRL